MTLPLDQQLHIHYPSSDGKPMADNTRQWNWITFIKNGLEETTAGKDIFVASDLFWYPIEGNNRVRVAPDVMVAIGRPKGDRNSYLQWKEEHIAPQIVFEILSKGNTKREMERKLLFYQKHSVQEYYVYDPFFNTLEIYQRKEERLIAIETNNWISPLLKFQLLWTKETLEVYQPDGKPFLSYAEIMEKMKATQVEVDSVRIEANNAKIEADNAKRKAALLAAKLKELGFDPDEI